MQLAVNECICPYILLNGGHTFMNEREPINHTTQCITFMAFHTKPTFPGQM